MFMDWSYQAGIGAEISRAIRIAAASARPQPPLCHGFQNNGEVVVAGARAAALALLFHSKVQWEASREQDAGRED